MATKKKTTLKVETPIEEVSIAVEEQPVAVKEKPKKAAPKAARKFAPNDLIECRSVTYGELLLPGLKSQLLYTWAGYGDVTEVEFQDLQALRSRNSQYLKAPMFVIEDEELINQWEDLAKLYVDIVTTDIDTLFALPVHQFKSKLQNAPKGFRDAIKNIASAMILDGRLDSLQKIKAIDEILGTDLQFYIQ